VLRRVSLALVAAAGLAGYACAGGSSSTVSQAASPEGSPRRGRYTMLAEEIQATPALNLYEVVVRAHPEWLTVRTTGTSGQRKGLSQNTDYEIQVYIDTQRAGTTEILKSMSTRGVTLMRYYSASDAQTRFGSGNLNGAIQVVTTAK